MNELDQWLDEYISQKVAEMLPEMEAPAPPKRTEEPSHTSGWYTGQRKHPPVRRREPPRKEAPVKARELKSEPEPKPEPKSGPAAKPEPEQKEQAPQPKQKSEEAAPEKKKAPKAAAPKKKEPKPSAPKRQASPAPKAAPVQQKPVQTVAPAVPPEGGRVQGRKRLLGRKQRIRGLRRRWLFNSMSMVAVVVVLVVIMASIFIGSYFYSAMQSGLSTKAKTAAEFFTNYETESEYRARASAYVANFSETDSVELEFLNSKGEVIFSSYSYQQTSGITPGTVDITNAINNGTTSSWTGSDTQTGERIMAVSVPVVQNGSVKGVIRMVTSMHNVDRQVILIAALLLLAGLVILVLIYLMNLYFVRSILEPMAAITDTAKRIAAGSYGVQIEKKYDDEIGELADTINDMSQKISQTEKLKSEFISSVSHELRTPLTAINGWAETLLRGEVNDPRDVHKGLAIIVSEARRLTKMVEELLEFSRIEDGRFTLRIEMIDIKAELEDAVYTYREFFRKKGITLEYNDTGEEFPPIPGDPERLRQVFSNLLDNAAKHGGSGKRITVSIHADGDFVAIRIRDFGPGIPPEELPHVKTKFYKGSSKARGSGIGLAVCDEIAVRHNGSLDIANALGGGCVVTLRLPFHGES